MHKILVITIAASAVVMLAEMRYKDNVLLTVARALLVGLQGIWFIQIGYIMFRRECALHTCTVSVSRGISSCGVSSSQPNSCAHG